jgi:hypothetical protein
VGLDDHWQNCTRVCANGTVIPSWLVNHGFDYLGCENNTGSYSYPWYSDDGVPQVLRHATVLLPALSSLQPPHAPQVDEHRFPDMKGMTSKAHQLGLRVGW